MACVTAHTVGVRARLAPSPTGNLHLGNAWSFLLAWLACRSRGGTLVLRMEDLDPERCTSSFASAIMEDLHWLGLDWDEGPDMGGSCGPYVQSGRQELYEAALRRLDKAGLLYPCYCTRRELRELAGAPHPHSTRESLFGDLGAPYPGTCRNLDTQQRLLREKQGRRACLRLRCPAIPIAFTDAVYRRQWESTPEQWGGDFALQRSDGVTAYQLAVVVDDGLMGITQVVRGADLLSSTPRQLLLFDLLGFPKPEYAHVPLLCDAEGFRLAKRHKSLSLRSLRTQGVSPEAILGYLAYKADLYGYIRPVQAEKLVRDLIKWRTSSPRYCHQLFPDSLGTRERLFLEADLVPTLLAVR